VVIEQAKGMLAEYLTMTVNDAFDLLRKYARGHNRKLSDVASDVVDRTIPSEALITEPGQES
jgi:AmiR/NasT family two-component response regulator